MRLLDIHTHNISSDNVTAILNSMSYIEGRNISIGIHPWDITENWKEAFSLIRQNAYKENVIAIGECGIDKIKANSSIETQKVIFKEHAILAEDAKKPLIIHCVKGVDEILQIYKEIAPAQAWIIHGFRGKPQQVEQITRAGLYISFGEKFNAESIKTAPVDRIFAESDESIIGISDIYNKIANAIGCSVDYLVATILQNAERCNIKL